jgi:murein DD-endopeptidase MepM/ murein hydrolase activator NlpD
MARSHKSTASVVPVPLPVVPATEPQARSRRELRERESNSDVVSTATLSASVVSSPAVTSSVVPVGGSAAARGRSTAPRGLRRSLAVSGPVAPIRRNSARRFLKKLVTVGAMTGVAALLVSTSLPANAFFSSRSLSTGVTTTEAVAVQKMAAEPTIVVTAPARDSYTVVSVVQQIKAKFAPVGGTYAYTNDVNGTIQWPFPVPVPITYGFGPRQVSGCGYCSTFHEGIDFTPGAGVAIGAIADGVVSKVEHDSGGLGNNVWIDHVIKGQKVTSVYAHMLNDSIRVVVGQAVKVTEQIGQVGSTGASTGAHLHLEIHLGSTPVDPFAWMKANAN